MATPSLPANFIWGFATAAYQIEGAITQDSRGPSIWDVFCSKPGKIADSSSGEIACDSYNRTAEDIALLKLTGAQAYRFSISWSRIIPKGGRHDPINPAGLAYYVRLVDDLLESGITPMVTLFHWDLPEELYRRYEGFLNKDEFVKDFTRYAEVVFEALCEKVKYWITFNEPYCSAILGHSIGSFAPGRTSDRSKSSVGDSSTEPWLVAHSILVAHGTVVDVFRRRYRRNGSKIGVTLNGDWAEPWDPSCPHDIAAATRRVEFFTAWFADPIYHGDYPPSMRSQLGSRLPYFTPSEALLVRGSNDFYGMNHYTANYIRHKPDPASLDDYEGNLHVLSSDKFGTSIGPETQGTWLRPNPEGFRKLLNWISARYGRPEIYVTENGTSIKDESEMGKEEILDDEFRVKYFEDYVGAMAAAVAIDGVDCRGYMAWSLLDNFEWADGYVTRFGCTYVDYENGQKRYPKKSARKMAALFDRYIGKADEGPKKPKPGNAISIVPEKVAASVSVSVLETTEF